jgi:hypothetical protein
MATMVNGLCFNEPSQMKQEPWLIAEWVGKRVRCIKHIQEGNEFDPTQDPSIHNSNDGLRGSKANTNGLRIWYEEAINGHIRAVKQQADNSRERHN